MTKRILDPATLAKLGQLQEVLELCDESGRTLGYFHPVSSSAAVNGSVASPFSKEELQRRRQQRSGRPLAEILSRLEKS